MLSYFTCSWTGGQLYSVDHHVMSDSCNAFFVGDHLKLCNAVNELNGRVTPRADQFLIAELNRMDQLKLRLRRPLHKNIQHDLWRRNLVVEVQARF